MNWEVKYKTCRAAFLEMGRIQRREEKARTKDRQRIIQLARDGINSIGNKPFSALGVGDKFVLRQFEKILGILKVSGFE